MTPWGPQVAVPVVRCDGARSGQVRTGEKRLAMCQVPQQQCRLQGLPRNTSLSRGATSQDSLVHQDGLCTASFVQQEVFKVATRVLVPVTFQSPSRVCNVSSEVITA